MQKIGIIGGTGAEGKGLAARFAKADLDVTIGSRVASKGEEVARELSALAGREVAGGTNLDAALAGEIVILTVPYEGMAETLEALKFDLSGKVVVSSVVALEFVRRRVTLLEVPGHSAAEEAQALLVESRVVGAFQNLAAGTLIDLAHPVDSDVFVCGDDAESVQQVRELAELIEGVRGVNAGPLYCSRYVEGITALQVNVNRLYKARTHVRIVGI